METQQTFLSQGTEFLGDLNTKLRDLRGYGVLMNELLQNADDAKNPLAHTIVFDVRDDALVVENDGIFSDCGKMGQRECPWRDDPTRKQHRCDFHRFRRIAGGDKRREADTTGAFGIGFIAVYQITDHPSLISHGRHWEMFPDNPEQKRISEIPDATGCTGTRFIFPWASDPNTFIRTELNVPAITGEEVEKIFEVISTGAPKAILFLKNIQTIKIQRNGALVKRVERVNESNKILVADGTDTQLWYVFAGSFEEEATRLRLRHPKLIEEKKKPGTVVALASDNMNDTGLFCATLPTTQSTELPLHSNADFYTGSSRKRLSSLEDDYEGQWNKAAVSASAVALISALAQLPELLGHKALWEFFKQVKRVYDGTQEKHYDSIMAVFWNYLQVKSGHVEIVYSSQGNWYKPDRISYLRSQEEVNCLPLFDILGIPCVHSDLRVYNKLLPTMGVPDLNLFDIAESLKQAGLDEKIVCTEAPPWLQSVENQKLLADAILSLAQRPEKRLSDMRIQIGACSIFRSVDAHFCPANSLWRTNKQVIELLSQFGVASKLMDPTVPVGLHEFVRELNARGAVQLLEGIDDNTFKQIWRETPHQVISLIKWLSHIGNSFAMDDSLRSKLVSLRIWPSGANLHALTQLFIPGGFEDIFGQTSVVDKRVAAACSEFLTKSLHARELTFRAYVTTHIPRLFEQKGFMNVERCNQLVQMLIEHRQTIEDDKTINQVLSSCALIECTDGILRSAKGVYFHSEELVSVLGDNAAIVQIPVIAPQAVERLYKALGVAQIPRSADVINRIHMIMAQIFSQSSQAISTMQSIVVNLGLMFGKLPPGASRDYIPLQTTRWLPVEGNNTSWATPSGVSSCSEEFLFSTTGTFLKISRGHQQQIKAFIEFLGIKSAPKCDQVVGHLLNCAKSQKNVDSRVYGFLNRNANDPAIQRLKSEPCIHIEGVGYCRPGRIFWHSHPFAPYLQHLGPGFEVYRQLMDQIGVQDDPQPEIVIRVLEEIQRDCSDKQLDEKTNLIVRHCWRFLSRSMEQKSIQPAELAKHSQEALIPNNERFLTSPSKLFFEDRPTLKNRFEGYFAASIVPYTKEEGPAMCAAGLRPLSDVVETRLVEHGNPIIATEIMRRVQDRLLLIERVFYQKVLSGDATWDVARLEGLKIFSCSPLQIGYSTQAFGTKFSMQPTDTVAHFDRDRKTIYVKQDAGAKLWTAFARELSIALDDVTLTSNIKDVLSADTYEDAQSILDEMDVPLLPSSSDIVTAISTQIEIDDGEPSGMVSHPETDGNDVENEDDSDEEDSDEETLQSVSPLANVSQNSTGIGNGESVKQPLPPLNSDMAPLNSSQSQIRGEPVRETYPTSESEHLSDGGSEPSTSTYKDPRSQVGLGKVHANSDSLKRKAVEGQRANKRQGGRLRSYVYPTDGNAEADPGSQEKRTAVGRKGVERVLAAEKKAGRFAKEMPPNNPGFDIQSTNSQGQIERVIEIKSITGYWGETGVGLSDKQFDTARELGEQFWLYVVECAEDDQNFNIVRIQAPFCKVKQFLFDDGWRDLDIGD